MFDLIGLIGKNFQFQLNWSDGQIFVAMRWRWSFFEAMRCQSILTHVAIANDAIICLFVMTLDNF